MDSKLTLEEFRALKNVQMRFGTYGMLAFIISNANSDKIRLGEDLDYVDVDMYLESMGLKRKASYELVMK